MNRGVTACVATLFAGALLGSVAAWGYFNETKTVEQPISVARITNSVVIDDPGKVIRDGGFGRFTFTATATSPTGVREVEFQARVAGTTQWFPFGTDTNAPYSAPYDTSTEADGRYEVRAVMTAFGGATATSPVVLVVTDNDNPPGPTFRGSEQPRGSTGRQAATRSSSPGRSPLIRRRS